MQGGFHGKPQTKILFRNLRDKAEATEQIRTIYKRFGAHESVNTNLTVDEFKRFSEKDQLMVLFVLLTEVLLNVEIIKLKQEQI